MPHISMPPATCPCRWCRKPTTMLGTRECDPCHEVRMRMEYTDPDLLAKMLVVLGKVEGLEEAVKRYKENPSA